MATDILYKTFSEAVAKSDLPTVVRCISEGFDVNTLVDFKWNLLHMSLMGIPPRARVNPHVIMKLIEVGVDVNAADRAGRTPLHFAARTGSTEAVQLLLDAGAKVNAQDEEGITPLHQALLSNNRNMVMIEALLEAGADPDIPMQDSSARIFSNRVASGNIKEVRQLLAKYSK